MKISAPARLTGSVPGAHGALAREVFGTREASARPAAGTISMREPCASCGSTAWREAHFASGVLTCAPCWRQQQKSPAGQQTLNLASAAQREGVPNG